MKGSDIFLLVCFFIMLPCAHASETLQGTIEIDPETAYNYPTNKLHITIFPPEGYSINGVSDIKCNGVKPYYTWGEGEANAGVVWLYISDLGLVEVEEPTQLKVTGKLSDGNDFEASGTVELKHYGNDYDGKCEETDKLYPNSPIIVDCERGPNDCTDFTCDTKHNIWCINGWWVNYKYCEKCLDADTCGHDRTVDNNTNKCENVVTCRDNIGTKTTKNYCGYQTTLVFNKYDTGYWVSRCVCEVPPCWSEPEELPCDFDKVCEGSEEDIGCPDCAVGDADCDDFSCYITEKKYCFNNGLWDYKYCEICMDADECDPDDFNVAKYMPKVECQEFYTCPDGTEVPYCRWNFEGNYEIEATLGKFIGEDETESSLGQGGGGGPTCECEEPKCPEEDAGDEDDYEEEEEAEPEIDEDEEEPEKEDKQTVIHVINAGGETKIHEISISKSSSALRGELKTKTAAARYSNELIVEGSTLYMKVFSEKKAINVMPEEAISISGVLDVEDVELNYESQKTVYVVKGKKQARVLFIIPISMEVETKVDAETGEQISVGKPWWGFLAR